MTTAISLSGTTPSPAVKSGPATEQQQQLTKAARQFEAIFVRQMLAAAGSTDFGGKELFGSSGEETFREMRDARFAEITSETGALGLAASIEAQLARLIGPGN